MTFDIRLLHMPNKLSTAQFIKRCQDVHNNKYNYSSVVYEGLSAKVEIICPQHGTFSQIAADHQRGSGCKKCAQLQREETNLAKYGVKNPLSNGDMVKTRMLELYGVSNTSKLQNTKDKKRATCLKNFGVENPTQSELVRKKTESTNLIRYGHKSPMQNEEISARMMKTKIENGSFSKSNSSSECTKFCKDYIEAKGYAIEQVAFADPSQNLFEWGYYYKGTWLLFDLVIFEKGFRGSIDHIIEVIEWHGPFHYTLEQSKLKGDQPATPWKSNKTTVAESFARDELKREFVRSLGKQLIEHWSEKYHPNEVIVQNVKKLEARYPGGKFDVTKSENRKRDDI